MNPKLLSILLLACLAGCGPNTSTVKKEDTAAQSQDVTSEFRPLMEKILAAWGTLDASQPAQYYAKDPDLAFFDVAPLKYTGWQEYADGFAKEAGDWKSMKVSLGPDFRATRVGNVVWATYTVNFEIDPKKGSVMKLDGRGTDIFEKRGDNWLIVHEHASVPLPEPAPPAGKSK
jgi:ketosteroid isomerase-like protein